MATFLLENGPWRTKAEAPDLRSALHWAVRNWHPAQGSRNPAGGFNLSRHLTIDGVPLMEALAADEQARAA